ncbi:hypothetical protein [Microbacterium sp. P03]|uniref:hypothetical protein n=1 Tax=Microbacterium sp. P03 TaxID=3366946 RepID=UPI003746DDE3
MVAAEIAERRRIAVLDGGSRYELALAPDVLIAEALSGFGIELEPGHRVLLERSGHEVRADVRAQDLADGAVLALVDLTEPPPVTDAERTRTVQTDAAASVWWMLGAFGLLLASIALALPTSIGEGTRVVLAVAAAAGAVASAAVWVLRARTDRPLGAAAASGPLTLAFAAGVVSVPPLPASTATLAVLAGLCAAAVLAALLGLLARTGVMRAELGTTTVILLGLVAVWALAVAMAVPASAPAAVALGAVPVALRALPSTLLDVPPGMFIDFGRFQTSRWAVRQHVPAEGGPIASNAARDLVGRSSSRLLVGTALLSAVAAASAPFAVPDVTAADPLVFAGRIALICCAALALLLGARRSSAPILRWMPRLAALVVIVVALAAAIRAAGPLWLTVAAGGLLVAGLALAFLVVPVGRGARSLAWSRFGDVLEWLAVVLALPAGLLAADVIDLLRGMMGA